MKLRFSLLLDLCNQEEAEAGETSRRGWTDSTLHIFDKPEYMTLRDALDCLHYVESREYSGTRHIYYGHSETTWNLYPRGDVQPGDDQTISLVLPPTITEASASRIDRILKSRNLMR